MRARTSSGASTTSKPSIDALPSLGPISAVRSADGRRLAGAVGPQEAEDLAAIEREVEVPDRPEVAEAATQVARLDRRAWS